MADLTRGNLADITATRNMPLPPDSILVFDMGYYDFSKWNRLDSMNSWFVTHSKNNLYYQIVEGFEVSEDKDKKVL